MPQCHHCPLVVTCGYSLSVMAVLRLITWWGLYHNNITQCAHWQCSSKIWSHDNFMLVLVFIGLQTDLLLYFPPHPGIFTFHLVGGLACKSTPLFNDGLFLYCVMQQVITGKPQHSWNMTPVRMLILISVHQSVPELMWDLQKKHYNNLHWL